MATSNTITAQNVVVAFLFLPIFLLITGSTSAAQSSFKCSSSVHNCQSLIGYSSPNATTLAALKNLFNVKNLRSILGANNLPLSTPATQRVPANQTLKIPIPCLCANATGESNKVPVYTVVSGDGLDHIARVIFSGLVTYQQIQAANNIPDPNLIKIDQELWIPLPCSCDEVEGQRVVHYGQIVAAGSSIEGIAQQFNTSQDVLMRLNGLAAPQDLLAGAVLDIPLKACSSLVSNSSLDYPYLVPNGAYDFTAANCVMCKCDAAANNWTLQCEPSQINSSLWQTCPSMRCQQSSETLYIGNSTSSSSSCNRTTCSYAGYTNQTILTTISLDSTCPAASDNNDSGVGFNEWRLSFMVIAFHLMMLLCIQIF